MPADSSFADLAPSNSSAPALDCFSLRQSFFILAAFSVTNVLLVLPLSTLVLYLGFQRWMQQRQVATATATSHLDVFTYHMVVMETLAVLCCLLYCAGVSTNLSDMTAYVFDVFFCLWSTKVFFHPLTCVEHYLAVVHPVTYRRLRTEAGMRLRNGTVGCVWLLCFVWGFVIFTPTASLVVSYFCFLTCAFTVVCFCCVSVLHALRRPGPGEAAHDRERVDRVKRRAFNTVVVIMAALWLCLGGTLACNAFYSSRAPSDGNGCAVLASSAWFSLPSSLVLPLLYLHRAGKLPCCKY